MWLHYSNIYTWRRADKRAEADGRPISYEEQEEWEETRNASSYGFTVEQFREQKKSGLMSWDFDEFLKMGVSLKEFKALLKIPSESGSDGYASGEMVEEDVLDMDEDGEGDELREEKNGEVHAQGEEYMDVSLPQLQMSS